MLRITTLFALFLLALNAQAKIWRVNNNAGISADFNDLGNAVSNASVLAGDTIHLEPSNTAYNFTSGQLNKRLVFIGVGYFLNPADGTTPGNAGLQVYTIGARINGFNINTGGQGSRFLGLIFEGSVTFFAGVNGNFDIIVEKCLFANGQSLVPGSGNYSGLTVRKCYFQGGALFQSSGTMSNFICENNIFAGNAVGMPVLTGSNNIIRNNSFFNSGGTMSFANAYVANNIFGYGGTITFTNCTVKNNIFQQPAASQPVPGTATGNQFNVAMSNVYVGAGTGISTDGRIVLKTGSPAIGAGVTVGPVVSPDCGAFGATDPYRLSGIPNVPSIYNINAPISIPAGTATMNVTISTRNNN